MAFSDSHPVFPSLNLSDFLSMQKTVCFIYFSAGHRDAGGSFAFSCRKGWRDLPAANRTKRPVFSERIVIYGRKPRVCVSGWRLCVCPAAAGGGGIYRCGGSRRRRARLACRAPESGLLPLSLHRRRVKDCLPPKGLYASSRLCAPAWRETGCGGSGAGGDALYCISVPMPEGKTADTRRPGVQTPGGPC